MGLSKFVQAAYAKPEKTSTKDLLTSDRRQGTETAVKTNPAMM